MATTQSQLLLTCHQYDLWKDEQLKKGEPIFSDKAYYEARKDYFGKWRTKILLHYEEYEDYKYIFLPPYTLEQVEGFEIYNNICIPVQFKYYITHISRYCFRANFQIYDINYDDDGDDLQFIVSDNYDQLKSDIKKASSRMVEPSMSWSKVLIEVPKSHSIFNANNQYLKAELAQIFEKEDKEKRKVKKMASKTLRGEEVIEADKTLKIDNHMLRYYLNMKQIEQEQNYPFLKLSMLKNSPQKGFSPKDSSYILQNHFNADCDECSSQIVGTYNYCDICVSDLCSDCLNNHDKSHTGIEKSHIKENIWRKSSYGVDDEDDNDNDDKVVEKKVRGDKKVDAKFKRPPLPNNQEYEYGKTLVTLKLHNYTQPNTYPIQTIANHIMTVRSIKSEANRFINKKIDPLSSALNIIYRKIIRIKYESAKTSSGGDNEKEKTLNTLRALYSLIESDLVAYAKMRKQYKCGIQYSISELENKDNRFIEDDRSRDGAVSIGEYGCGEVQYLIVNGPYKGYMDYPKATVCGHHFMMYSKSFFDWLLYNDGVNMTHEDDHM